MRFPIRIQVRTLYKKPGNPITYFVKNDIDMHVHELLFEYANVPDEKVSLYANLEYDLLIDARERVGLYFDILERFRINIPSDRTNVRDLKSGKEYADWVAAQLEENGRLADYPSK